MLTVSIERLSVSFLRSPLAALKDVGWVASVWISFPLGRSRPRLSGNACSIVAILIKNGRLEFSAIRDLDVPTIPDRYCPAICQPSKRPADSFQRYAYIGADIGTFHRQIYFL